VKAGRAATAALASGALITGGGSAAAVIATVAEAHPAGACGWTVPADDATHHYHNVPLSDGHGDYVGDITLFYDPCTRDVKGLVTTGNFGPCDAINCVGTAQIYLNGQGQPSPCHIPDGGTFCKTNSVDDAGIQQYAKGRLTLSGPGIGTVVFQGVTSAY
jgi:hypothetical protein